jgi:pyruvate dehydrogenase E1 component beta subunit/2-oxoisovalerate dehydrogenase E1 component beta subunit
VARYDHTGSYSLRIGQVVGGRSPRVPLWPGYWFVRGAFKATKNLAKEFPGRILDAPLSEDAIVGIAIGAAIEGMRPIVEMQFADFSTCGFNQIVNHAATLFYRTEVPCPIVRCRPGHSRQRTVSHQSMEAVMHYPGVAVMTPGTVDDVHSMFGWWPLMTRAFSEHVFTTTLLNGRPILSRQLRRGSRDRDATPYRHVWTMVHESLAAADARVAAGYEIEVVDL